MEWERGCEGQDTVLSLEKEEHARDKSGEAGGPAVAPCTVIVWERGREKWGKKSMEIFDPAGGHR